MPEGHGGRAVLLPRRPVGQDDRLAPPRARGEAGHAVVRLLRDRLQPRSAPRSEGVGGQVQGHVRRGLGRHARADLRAPEGARRRPARRGAAAAQRRLPDLGLAERDRAAPLRAPDGDVRRLLGERRLERRPRPRRDRGDGRAREHARDLDLGRQRRQHGGHPHGHVQRDDDAERDPADARAADGAPVQARRPRGLGRRPHGPALLGGLGVGEQHPLRLGQAGRLAPRRDAEPARRPLPEGDLRSGLGPRATSRT